MVTSQHPYLATNALDEFGIAATRVLAASHSRDPADSLADLVSKLADAWHARAPDLVVVQGDTMSAVAGALVGSYLHSPVAHIEAGLRTFDASAPFPEELNRTIITRAAAMHFAPTPLNVDNLVREAVDPNDIYLVGNTGVDALHWALTRRQCLDRDSDVVRPTPQDRRIVVTLHRRENIGKGILDVLHGLKDAMGTLHLVHKVYLPVHPNPAIGSLIHRHFADDTWLTLLPPQPYVQFIALLARAALVVTDSGGVQEDVTHLGGAALIARTVTERPESLEQQRQVLVGTAREDVCGAAVALLQRPCSDEAVDTYRKRVMAIDTFGDGRAAVRILRHLEERMFGKIATLRNRVPGCRRLTCREGARR